MLAYAESRSEIETESMAYSPQERVPGIAYLNAKPRLLDSDNNTARRTKTSDRGAKGKQENIEK